MSRIGKKPIEIPDGVKVSRTDNKLQLTGPKGKMEIVLHPSLTVQIDESTRKIKISCEYKVAQDKAIHGTFRSIINNAVLGVANGYEKKIEVHGVGYNAKIDGAVLLLNLGYTKPVRVDIPKALTVTLPNPNLILIQGVDKYLVGEFSASLRGIKVCDPYNLKGLKYAEEIIKRKPGKTFVSGATT